MGNLYRLILRKTRTTDTLHVIIDQLAYLFEDERDKKQKNHPEDRRRFFAGIISYAEKKYNCSLETLLIYIQLACECVNGLLKEKSQKEFLVPVFQKISNMRFRNVAFKVFDYKVQEALVLNEEYFKLWEKYNPEGSEQRVTPDGAAKT